MKKRLPWGHESRHCARCGKVGPRTFLVAAGYVHSYCLTPKERQTRRATRRTALKALAAIQDDGRSFSRRRSAGR